MKSNEISKCKKEPRILKPYTEQVKIVEQKKVLIIGNSIIRADIFYFIQSL